jgi:NADPH:quinone reductase-like Zn-dependent oxidoreductase
MKAVRLHEYGGPQTLLVENVPDPEPVAGEALLQVEACGLNHFDIDLREGTSRIPLKLPHIPGLEVVGRVVSAPDDSPLGVEPGRRVLVHYEQTCGSCEFCEVNQANMCPNTTMFGVNRPGGYAQLVTARAADLVPVDGNLNAREWAAVQIAFGTAWHLVVTRARIRPGETVLVNAVGSGVSSAAIQIAKLAGARVIATAGSKAKLERAREFGVDETIDYSEVAIDERVAELTGGKGVDLAVEHVGGKVFAQTLRAVRSDGRLVTCGGHGGETVPLDLIDLFRSERRIYGSRTWTRSELKTVISLVQAGRFRPVVDSVFPLDEAPAAHSRLASRANYGKVVLSIQ